MQLEVVVVRHELLNLIDRHGLLVVIDHILQHVVGQMKPAEIRSRNNSKSVAMPRQIAMYLCKALTHASLPEIGRSFGGKHHSTVIHSIKKVDLMRGKSAEFDKQVANLLESIK